MTTEEVRKEWIRRLRSGEYEQGKGYLCFYGKYCCLGVLCEIAAEQKVVYRCETNEFEAVSFSGEHEETRVANKEVVEWAGLRSANGMPKNKNGRCLAEMNDLLGKSFTEIADLLETGEYWSD